MAEYITLLGAEQVKNAASQMEHAAQAMRNAASEFDSALERHRRFLDDWLMRLEDVLGRKAADPGAGEGRT